MTTLPLVWGEASDVGELLRADGGIGWVRQALETRHSLEPLDTLDEAALASVDRLVLAQPRALGPDENVALDAWVREGGTLLLFADPMLTRDSRFAIGDPRRPQDVVLLSPVLIHWGLTLTFDEDQAEGERTVEIAGVGTPVNLPGAFAIAPDGRCTLAGGGLLATCRLGRGRVVAVADAAVLDDARGDGAALRERALKALLQLAFP